MKKLIALVSVLFVMFTATACGQSDQTESPKKKEKNQQETEKPTEQDKPLVEKETVFATHSNFEAFTGSIEHIHGLGYAGNQNAIFFATHDGLKVFENGKWYKTKKENNDYMGFNAVEKGFISSGHPGADSNLPNPVGIVKSFDFGETIETLGLAEETDFHVMGVGYTSNVIYALPPNSNSKMKAGDLYVSSDFGANWEQVSASNLEKKVRHLAVHPTQVEIVAAAGEKGIYLSTDKGNTFELISKDMQGTTVFFTDEYLWYGGYDGEATLIKRSLSDGSEQEVTLPTLEQDAVMYLAQNPKNEDEIVFVSFNGDIYQSIDGAKTWNILVKQGELK